LVGGAATWPVAAGAQLALPRIGVLVPANPEPFLECAPRRAERARICRRTEQDGKQNRLRALADEFVRLKVDIIVAKSNTGRHSRKAGYDGDSDYHGAGGRSAGNRPRLQPGAAGRQHY